MSELCIILTAEQAKHDWSGSRDGTVLRPRLLADGFTWVLPARVLERAAHAAHHDYLKTLPQREVEESEFPTAQSPEEAAVMATAPSTRK